MRRPVALMVVGVALMLAGWLALFFVLLGFLASSFPLAFAAYGASFGGLVLGVIGVIEQRGRGG